MGVIIDPGWGQSVGDSLGQIGSGLSNILNPNQDEQKLFRQKLATDPNFAQQIANQAYSNPDMYTKDNPIVGSKNAKIIQNMGASTDYKIAQSINSSIQDTLNKDPTAVSEAAAKQGGFQTPEQRAAAAADLSASQARAKVDNLTADQLDKYNTFLASNPDAARDANFQKALGMTSDQYSQLKDKAALYKTGKDMAVKDPVSFLNDFANGKGDATSLEAFATANPTAFALADKLLDDKTRMAFQERLHGSEMKAQGLNNSLERIKLQTAAERASKSGATVGDAYYAIYGQEPPDGIQPHTDAGVKTFNDFEDKAGMGQLSSHITQINSQINQIMNAKVPQGMNPDQFHQQQVGQINQALAQRNKLTGSQIIYGAVKVPGKLWGTNTQYGFIGPDGKLIGTDASSIMGADATTGGAPPADTPSPNITNNMSKNGKAIPPDDPRPDVISGAVSTIRGLTGKARVDALNSIQTDARFNIKERQAILQQLQQQQ